MPASSPFGQRLQRERERAGISQAELGRRSGVPQSYLSLLESGQRGNPSLRVIAALALALGVDAAALAGFAPRPHLRGLPLPGHQ